MDYAEKAIDLSTQVDNPYCTAMSRMAATLSTLFFTEKTESSLEHARETLQHGLNISDNYFKGFGSYLLAFVTDWMAPKEVTPKKKKEKYKKIIKYAEDAIRFLKLVSQDFIIGEVYSWYTESYSSLANLEVNIREKRGLLEKAVESGRKGVEHSIHSGSLDAMAATLHALSKALYSYSSLKPRRDEKANLLEEALIHRKKYIEIVGKTFPSNDWILGVGKYYSALTKAELAAIEIDVNKKIALLKNAISDMEDGVLFCNRWLSWKIKGTYAQNSRLGNSISS